MTPHYLDIIARPDAEFATPTIVNSLFAKLHRRLVDGEITSVGISFPAEPSDRKGLGNVMRCHGSQDSLEDLMSVNWLGGLIGYLQVTAIKPAPSECSYRHVRRKQAPKSSERLKRRFVRHHGPEAAARFDERKVKRHKLPYLILQSASSGQRFSLFVDQADVADKPVSGEFNSYGLSKTASVPWF